MGPCLPQNGSDLASLDGGRGGPPNSGSYDQFWSILLSGFHLSLFIPFPLNSLVSFSVSQSLHLMMGRISIWKFMHFIDVKIHSILHKQRVFLRGSFTIFSSSLNVWEFVCFSFRPTSVAWQTKQRRRTAPLLIKMLSVWKSLALRILWCRPRWRAPFDHHLEPKEPHQRREFPLVLRAC